MLKEVQDAVPAETKLQWFIQVAGMGAALVPNIGLIPQTLSKLVDAGFLPTSVESIPLVVGGALAGFYGAKASKIFKGKKKAGIWVGDMFIEEDAFWTSMLITGRPGSGKTSGAIMPLAEQIFHLYNGPDYIEKTVDGKRVRVENPYAHVGGTVLEVKGEFYEKIAYLMHGCKRNVYEDFLIIRPDSSIPVAQFKDPETGYIFYVNALPCSTGSEAGRLLMAAQRAENVATPVREDIFNCEDKLFKASLELLQKFEYRPDKETCFVGWRQSGGNLLRVSHTSAYNHVEYVKDANGAIVTIPAPKTLKFIDRLLLSNGLHYNLIDPTVPASEAAEKLTGMASVAGRGESKGGDNSFWYNNAQKLIQQCIALRREVHPELDVTCADIYRMIAEKKIKVGNGAAEKPILALDLEALQRRIVVIRQDLNNITDVDKHNEVKRRKLEPIEAIADYFNGEWVGTDEKVKGTIKNVVSNTFSQFVFDPALAETFCSKATFSFADCMQKGTVFCFVPGDKYEKQAKTIGTGLKLDFQQAALQRLARADYNKKRPIIHLTDECWNWIVSGGSSGGDPKFLSLCREPRIMNILATQNYDQFISEIGRDTTNNYLGEFGVFVWLQNFNHETNSMAERLMGTVKREKLKSTGSKVNALDPLNSKGGAATMEKSWEEKKLFTQEDFIKLGGDEAIVFNGYRKHDMALKTKLPKSRLTHPDEKPLIEYFMREFLRGSIEQALWKLGRVNRADHILGEGRRIQEPQQVQAAAPTTVPVPPAAPQQTPTTKPSTQTPAPAPQNRIAPPPSEQTRIAQPPQTPPPATKPTPPTAAPGAQSQPQKPATPVPQQTPPPTLPTGLAVPPSEKANHTAPATPPLMTPAFKPPQQKQAPPAKPADEPEADIVPLGSRRMAGPRQVTPPTRLPTTFGTLQFDECTTESTKRDMSRTHSEDDDPENGIEKITPKQVDQESAEFKQMWGRLSTAAAELVTQDDFGISTWIQTILQKKQNGGNVAPDVMVGPHGHAAGSDLLVSKMPAIQKSQIDDLEQTKQAPYDNKKRRADETQYIKKRGPKWLLK